MTVQDIHKNKNLLDQINMIMVESGVSFTVAQKKLLMSLNETESND